MCSGSVFSSSSSVSTKGSDHPVQTQTLRLPCHLCRWSGKCLPGSIPTRVQMQFWLEYLFSWCSVFVPLAPGGLMDIEMQCVTLAHPLKCCSLLAGICCPRAARHSTAWCKWRALCKWSNIFETSVLGSHATSLFHPSDSLFTQPSLPVKPLLLIHPINSHVVYINQDIFLIFHAPSHFFSFHHQFYKGNICKIPVGIFFPLSS